MDSAGLASLLTVSIFDTTTSTCRVCFYTCLQAICPALEPRVFWWKKALLDLEERIGRQRHLGGLQLRALPPSVQYHSVNTRRQRPS